MTPAEQTATNILARQLPADEGTVPYAYQDHLGFWTIGVGFLIDKRRGGKLYSEEIDYILRNRIGKTLTGAQRESWYPAVANDANRLAGVLNFLYQLGDGGDEGFPVAFAAIGRKDWRGAGEALRNSKWAQQTPNRAARVIRMIEMGVSG